MDKIDFKVRLKKSESGRKFRQTTPVNKEAVFYSLPLNVPNSVINHELAGGVVEPMKNQFQGSISNYFTVQHFIDISNDKFGVTLSTIDAPVIEYGWPRPAFWRDGNDCERIIKKTREQPYLYLFDE